MRDLLPPLLRAVRETEIPVVWACDPMHANLVRTASGTKTRHFDSIMAEVQGFFASHREVGTWPGGVHIEFTGDDVTECLGGSTEVLEEQLDHRYETLCDPRLNGRQSLDLAFRVAELMRAASSTRMRLAIVGTGLIGASAGLAAHRAGFASVAGWDEDPGVLEVAAERGAVTPAESLEAALARARSSSSSPFRLPRCLRSSTTCSRSRRATATVTDAGSTKASVCRAAGDDPRFVGGHPICGAEARGPARASTDLFEGATWFLTPLPTTEPARYRAAHAFAAALGARPLAIDPGTHDRLVAVTSHLPHALANVLLNQAGSSRIDGHDPLSAAGGSLRDMTRVAGANPRIWVDIFLDNRDALAHALAEHRRRVEQLEKALADGDAGFLARWIGEASENRREMLDTAYEDAGALHRLRVHVPDRPGVLAGIFQALGAERLNVNDFELEHLSSDRGGTLTILVTGESEACPGHPPPRGPGLQRRRGARARRVTAQSAVVAMGAGWLASNAAMSSSRSSVSAMESRPSRRQWRTNGSISNRTVRPLGSTIVRCSRSTASEPPSATDSMSAFTSDAGSVIGNETDLHGVREEDVAERRRDHHLEAVVLRAPTPRARARSRSRSSRPRAGSSRRPSRAGSARSPGSCLQS